jgi:hypothetical protein
VASLGLSEVGLELYLWCIVHEWFTFVCTFVCTTCGLTQVHYTEANHSTITYVYKNITRSETSRDS